MSLMNSAFRSELQTKTLPEKIVPIIQSTDLSCFGIDNDGHTKDDFVVSGKKSHINRALFWLSSKNYDFIREPNKGGYLYSLLGSSLAEGNLQVMEEQLKQAFNLEFANDLEVIYVKLSRKKVDSNKPNCLVVNMVVRDLIDNSLYTIAKEASL